MSYEKNGRTRRSRPPETNTRTTKSDPGITAAFVRPVADLRKTRRGTMMRRGREEEKEIWTSLTSRRPDQDCWAEGKGNHPSRKYGVNITVSSYASNKNGRKRTKNEGFLALAAQPFVRS
uniref:Uncharacterized protein n=1 Tax=Cacopsylla melanoneura TaxID=428564 RepID=A0A8D9A6P7_9HEMI